MHKVAIYFYSEIITWIDTIHHNQLLFASGDHLEDLANGKKVETEMIILSPNVSIISYQQNNIAAL